MKRFAHLGCGKRRLEGYIHVDIADWPHIDYRHDIRTLPMFEDGSLDGIYASHVLEYFDRVEVVDVLREWRRTLRPGGLMRLAVPDFAALCGLYRETGRLDLVLGPLYGRWSPAAGVVIHHRTTYDFDSLAQLLQESGFEKVRRWDWRTVFTGPHAGYDDYSQAYYPHMDKDNGRLTSLNVEAEKAGDRP